MWKSIPQSCRKLNFISSNIPITNGQGQSSVAAEEIASLKYQQIKVAGGQVGSTSMMGVNSDGSINVQLTSGSNSADVLAHTGGSNSSVLQGGLLTAPAYMEVPFTTTTVQAVGTTDVGNYRWVGVQIVTQGGSSTVTFQGSNDNTNWVSVGLMISTAVGGTIAVVSTTAASSYYGPLHFRYFRLNVTGIVSGTTAGVIDFYATGTTLVGANFVSALSASTTGPMKAEDAASATGDQGFAVMQIRNDSPSTNASVSGNNDYTLFSADNLGKTWTADNQKQDSIYGTGDRGSFILGLRNEAASVLSTSDNRFTPIAVDNIGAVYTRPTTSMLTVWVSPSIVGTYAEDAASAGGDKGVFMLGVRNDTVASLVSADLDYTARSSDSAGRTLIKPFAPEESRIEGYHSVVSTSVTTLVAAAGAGIRNYITDIMIANTGATTTLITFKDGLGSILGYTIAPTAGGSNMIGFATPMRTGANASFDFQPTSASSIIFATVKGFKAP